MKCEVVRQFNAVPVGGIVEPPGTYRDYLIARGFIRPAPVVGDRGPEIIVPKALKRPKGKRA